MLFWKLWTVYTSMFAVTAILSCVINIRGLFKSTKCGRLKMSNLKLSQPGVNLNPTFWSKALFVVNVSAKFE